MEIHLEIIKDPQPIENGECPFLLFTPSDDYNYLITSGKSFKLYKKMEQLKKFMTQKIITIFLFI